ncbi:MAG: anti-sigma factor RsiW [Myxococcota bacterium]|jgi:anti-sigma factor RsiW
MNCDDIDNAIYVFLDGEFAAPEEADFEQHLKGCARCRHQVQNEARFLERVKTDVPRVVAPSGLEDRVRSMLAEAPAPEPYTPETRGHQNAEAGWLRWAGALAAALAIGLTWFALSGDGASPQDRFVPEVVASHQQDPPMEVRGSERQIQQFLQQNVPFVVELPFDAESDARLTGARLTRVNGHAAVFLSYALDGERLSVIQMAGGPAERLPDAAPASAMHQGYDVTTFRRGGITTSVIGSGPNTRRIMRASFKP